jgi:hypothetical protein
MRWSSFFRRIKGVFVRGLDSEIESSERVTERPSSQRRDEEVGAAEAKVMPPSESRNADDIKEPQAPVSVREEEEQLEESAFPPEVEEVVQSSDRSRKKQVQEREKRLINVGIDFGTSSTKIIYRDHIGGKAWIQTFPDNPKQYPAVVYPSAVRISEGKLYFGGAVENSKGGVVLRSFKMCMACQNGRISSDTCDIHYDSSVHPEPGFFSFPTSSSNIGILACELGTYYLAHVMGLAKRAVDKKFPSRDFDIRLTFNMCVPVDYQEHAQTNAAFQKALFLADSISDLATDGCRLEVLHRAYRDLDQEYTEIPPDEARNTFVQPESVSAVMSYALSRVADEGLYAIVDVGAGTTDVSIFRLADLPDRRLAIYSARSHTVGGNAIDSAVLKYLGEREKIPQASPSLYSDALKQQIKVLKERIGPEKPIKVRTKIGITKIDYGRFRDLTEPVAGDLFLRYRQTFRKAYEKEKKQSRWRSYSLFIIGGCSKIDSVGNKLAEKPSHIIENIEVIPLPFPDDLHIDNDDIKAQDLFFLLGVAYGLSFHPAEYPKILLPSEISPWAPSLREREDDGFAPWGPVYPDTK